MSVEESKRESGAAPGVGDAAGRVGIWPDLAPFGLCVLVGTLLAILPNLIWWNEAGGPFCLYDGDETSVYDPYAATAYRHGPSGFTDPYSLANARNHYPPLLFVPFASAARVLGLGPLGVGLLWRVFTGFGLSATLYLVVRQYLGRPWLASSLVMFLVSDTWNSPGRLIYRHFFLFYESFFGPAAGVPKNLWFGGGHVELQGHFRLINPGISLPFVWLFLFLFTRARDRPTAGRLVASGLGFGLLFYVYFYYWTAAGVALLLGCLVDVGRRRAYFATGCIGLAAGLPSLVDSSTLKAASHPDWSTRNSLFSPISRTAALSFPKGVLALFLPTLPWVWFRFRELLPLALLIVATILLRNHNLLTKLDTASYHWEWMLQGQAVALYLTVFVAALVTRYVKIGRRGAAVLAVLLAVFVGMGFRIRAFQATEAARPAMSAYHDYLAMRNAPGAYRLEPGSVLAGAYRFVEMAAILDDQRPLSGVYLALSRDLSDRDMDARIALDAVLSGLKRSEIGEKFSTFFPTTPGQRADREARYDQTLADPGPEVERFRVRYAALPVEKDPPAYLTASPDWKVVQNGPHYVLWERTR